MLWSDVQSESESHFAQSCQTLCNPMDYTVHNSPGQNTGVGNLSLLQLIFLAQESNQDLLHCRWILYQLSYEGLIIIALQEMDKDLWRKKTWPWLKWKCLITLISELSFSIKESQSEIKHIYYHNRKFIFS